MRQNITKEDVRYIAGLARIHLEDNELEHLTKDLEEILHYIAKLEKLNVDKVEPTSHVFKLKNVFRKDEIRPSLKQEEALKIAVEKEAGGFKVPQVVE